MDNYNVDKISQEWIYKSKRRVKRAEERDNEAKKKTGPEQDKDGEADDTEDPSQDDEAKKKTGSGRSKEADTDEDIVGPSEDDQETSPILSRARKGAK